MGKIIGSVGPVTFRGTAPSQGVSRNAAVQLQNEGLVVRFSPVSGVTPKSALNRKIWLPALLNTLEVDEDALHNEYDTLSRGQFSQGAMGGARARRLRTSSLDTLVLDLDAMWLVARGQDPVELRTRLFEILRSKKAVRMLITWHPSQRRGPEFDGHVTFRSLNRQLRPGENETRYLTLAISDWRDPSVQRRSSRGGSRKRGVHLPTTHKLKATDTLHSLSFEFYGTYAFAGFIRDANGVPRRWGVKTPLSKIGGHFKVGAKIKIPAIKGSVAPITAAHAVGADSGA